MFPRNMTVKEAFEKIEKSNLIWDQLICEHDSKGTVWIHASIVNGPNRKDVIPNLLKENN